jgi:hypothetical protein
MKSQTTQGIRTVLFVCMLLIGMQTSYAHGEEITTQENYNISKEVSVRQEKFLVEEKKINAELDALEEQRKNLAFKVVEARSSKNSLAVYSAKSEYLALRTEILKKDAELAQKGLRTLSTNLKALNKMLIGVKKENMRNMLNDKNQREKLDADLAKMHGFLENINHVRDSLLSLTSISQDMSLVTKLNTAKYSASNVKNYITKRKHQAGRNGGGLLYGPAIASISSHLSQLKREYLATKEWALQISDQKKRARMAILVTDSELSMYSLSTAANMKELEIKHRSRNNIMKDRSSDDSDVYGF